MNMVQFANAVVGTLFVSTAIYEDLYS